MHPLGYVGGAGIAVFYTLFSAVLQYCYYYRDADGAKTWKIQPDKGTERLGGRALLPWVPGFEAFTSSEKRLKRAPYHWLFATINVTLASSVAAFTVDAIASGRSNVYLAWPEHFSTFDCLITWAIHTIAIVTIHQIEEYYWHRLMHLPWFYVRFHKLHHHYKSPEPFDDLYIHPLEALGYYL